MPISGNVRGAAVCLIALASAYLLLLSGLFTAGIPITNAAVIGVDAAVVLAALTLALVHNPRLVLLPLLGICLSFAILALFSEAIDLKSVRDATLIVTFLSLGISVGDYRTAQRAFWTVSALVIAFGAFELLFPNLYSSIFRILQFYIMRGEIDPRVSEYVDTSLFVSSVRNEGRFLLPWLGPHRVSSIFIEPVSMGNFGAIAVAWALSFSRRQWRTALAVGFIGAGAIVLADARFAALVVLVFVLARFVPVPWMRAIIAPAPAITIAILLIVSIFVPGSGDDLPTRLALSGRAIAELDIASIFGLAGNRNATLDAGYAYVLTAFGLPLCLALWAAFVWLPTPGPQSARFKFLIGLYLCALLCVSGSSLFALKTAGLAWFLLGSAIAGDFAAARLMPRVVRIETAPKHNVTESVT